MDAILKLHSSGSAFIGGSFAVARVLEKHCLALAWTPNDVDVFVPMLGNSDQTDQTKVDCLKQLMQYTRDDCVLWKVTFPHSGLLVEEEAFHQDIAAVGTFSNYKDQDDLPVQVVLIRASRPNETFEEHLMRIIDTKVLINLHTNELCGHGVENILVGKLPGLCSTRRLKYQQRGFTF